MRMDTPHGLYKIKIPRKDGAVATFSGACLDSITETFPSYPLKEIKKDIDAAFVQGGGEVGKLPMLLSEVGGDTDFMVGAKYLKHFPDLEFKLPSGLCIYVSQFFNEDGSTGVIGGPHPIIEMIDKRFYGHQLQNFLTSQYHVFKNGFQVNPDVHMLGYKAKEEFGVYIEDAKESGDLRMLGYTGNESLDSVKEVISSIHKVHQCTDEDVHNNVSNEFVLPSIEDIDGAVDIDDEFLDSDDEFLDSDDELLDSDDEEEAPKSTNQFNTSIQRKLKLFQQTQEAGSEISYRCPKCRACKECKDHGNHGAASMRGELNSRGSMIQ